MDADAAKHCGRTDNKRPALGGGGIGSPGSGSRPGVDLGEGPGAQGVGVQQRVVGDQVSAVAVTKGPLGPGGQLHGAAGGGVGVVGDLVDAVDVHLVDGVAGAGVVGVGDDLVGLIPGFLELFPCFAVGSAYLCLPSNVDLGQFSGRPGGFALTF